MKQEIDKFSLCVRENNDDSVFWVFNIAQVIDGERLSDTDRHFNRPNSARVAARKSLPFV